MRVGVLYGSLVYKNMGERGVCTSSYVESTRSYKKFSEKSDDYSIHVVEIILSNFQGAGHAGYCVAATTVWCWNRANFAQEWPKFCSDIAIPT